jgi:hypothetical protein
VFGLAAGGLALGAAMAWAGALTERAQRADREAAEHQYEQLVTAAHRIEGVSVGGGQPPAVDVDVTVAGSRVGEYVLDWRLRELVYDSTLAAGSRILRLSEGEVRETVTIDTAGVRAAYDRSVLSGDARVLVDEDFDLLLTLRPILTPAEEARLPDDEVREFERGESELISSTTAPFPVQFELP